MEGHRPLVDVFDDITALQKITNCDCIKISGGEPLIYPHILDVVAFISKKGMKPLILTNGHGLDQMFARELEKAGLKRINFHIDSAQNRPGWEKKNEAQLNELRQHYADLIWGLKGISCGFNMTVSRSNLAEIPDIVGWAMDNIHKVGHIALIALRGIHVDDDMVFFVNGKQLDPDLVPNRFENKDEITITTEDMLEVINKKFPGIQPCAYIGGTSVPDTNKYLVSIQVGTKRHSYGSLGARTVEFVQILKHLAKGKYATSSNHKQVGRRLFLLSPFDPEVRRILTRYLKLSIKNPARLFDRIYAQPIALEQPLELIDGEINLCDGCINMMIYRGRLIPSCRLDEYRLFDAPLIPHKVAQESSSMSERRQT
jgi:hypothetical protein